MKQLVDECLQAVDEDLSRQLLEKCGRPSLHVRALVASLGNRVSQRKEINCGLHK